MHKNLPISFYLFYSKNMGEKESVDKKQESVEKQGGTIVTRFSQRIVDALNTRRMLPEIRQVYKKIHVISHLDNVYAAYQKPFADKVARYAIAKRTNHAITYGHFKDLHDMLQSEHLLDDERQNITDNLDRCARNFIRKYDTDQTFGSSTDIFDLLKAEYISEDIKQKAIKSLIKKAKNIEARNYDLKKIAYNKEIPEEISKEAIHTLERKDQQGLGKHKKR